MNTDDILKRPSVYAVWPRVTVTPTLAQELLLKNTKNRTLSRNVVNRYAGAMSAGLWGEGDSAICLDSTGALINGQHRLVACIETGVLMVATIITGMPPESFRFIDRQAKRTFAQELKLAGVSNSSLMASVSRLLFTWRQARRGPYKLLQQSKQG
jgi:hypothetical protein